MRMEAECRMCWNKDAGGSWRKGSLRVKTELGDKAEGI